MCHVGPHEHPVAGWAQHADSDGCLGLIGLGQRDEVLLTLPPDPFQLFDPVWMLLGQIACFCAVRAQVEEFPGFALRRDQFPVTDSDGSVALV